MNKTNRRFPGLFLALVTAAAMLMAGCSLDNSKPTAGEDPPPPEGTVWVKLRLTQTDSRSLSDASRGYIDLSEIFMRDRGLTGSPIPVTGDVSAATVYSASAQLGEVLQVAVPPNHNYDILFLAGSAKHKALVASAFINASGSAYNTSGTGMPIVAGRTNYISLTVDYMGTNPKDDFTIADGVSGVFTVVEGGTSPFDTNQEYNGLFISLVPRKTIIKGLSVPTMKFTVLPGKTTEGLANLLHADDQARIGSPVTFPRLAAATMVIQQINGNSPDSRVYMEAAGDLATASAAGIVFTFDTATGGNAVNWPDPDPGSLNTELQGVYAKAYYDMAYYPFGRATGSKWHIRNGISPLYLDGGAGTMGAAGTMGDAILLVIGKDPGTFSKELVSVEF